MRKKNDQIRQLLIREAAHLMFDEGVEQYIDAKKKAAKRILGKTTRHLPSNGEIAEALYQLSLFYQGDSMKNQLFQMRLLAMDIMEQLAIFNPRLIGSVSTGRIRQDSDVDIHIFTDSIEELQNYLEKIGWQYELKQVWIEKNNRPVEYTHVYLVKEFPVELSVYPVYEIRVKSRSSTDGKLINRLSVVALRQLLMTEHCDEWGDVDS